MGGFHLEIHDMKHHGVEVRRGHVKRWKKIFCANGWTWNQVGPSISRLVDYHLDDLNPTFSMGNGWTLPFPSIEKTVCLEVPGGQDDFGDLSKKKMLFRWTAVEYLEDHPS